MIYFDVLISKKIKKKLILKYFQAKNYFEKYSFLFIEMKNIINKAFSLRRWGLQDKKDYWGDFEKYSVQQFQIYTQIFFILHTTTLSSFTDGLIPSVAAMQSVGENNTDGLTDGTIHYLIFFFFN
jgi:hypothetical protein